jgi:hypothetical protein
MRRMRGLAGESRSECEDLENPGKNSEAELVQRIARVNAEYAETAAEIKRESRICELLFALSEAMLLEEENSSSVLLSKTDDFLGLFERKGRHR